MRAFAGAGFPLARAFRWRGLSAGAGFLLMRAFRWRGLSADAGFPLMRAFRLRGFSACAGSSAALFGCTAFPLHVAFHEAGSIANGSKAFGS